MPNSDRPLAPQAARRRRLKVALAYALALAPLAGAGGWARAANAAVEVIGAGASFPAPAMDAWAEQYAQQGARRGAVTLLYRSVGSGEGMLRVTAHSADFAVTDEPLSQAELLQDDLLQFPLVLGAIVPVVNLPGLGDGALCLDGAVLAQIYLGKITRWDDPALQRLNPALALPALPIAVVHRSEGSGTSFVFTYYLSVVSTEWNERLGIGSRLVWPVGLAARGSEGVAQAVHDTPGAIGYVEYAYARAHGLAGARLRNRAGKMLSASAGGVRAALASARWLRPGYYEVLVDREGADSWPIVGVSFVLIHRRQEVRADALATLDFLRWIYAHGADAARKLQYVTLDDPELIGRIESSWSQIHDDDGPLLRDRQP
jgi:phosphate transport system substrate-binding protein